MLRIMGVLWSTVDLEFPNHSVTKPRMWQHATNYTAQSSLRRRRKLCGALHTFERSRPSCMMIDGFLALVAARKHRLGGIDDDHVIAAIYIRGVYCLVLAAEQPCSFHSHAAHWQAVCIDHVPNT